MDSRLTVDRGGRDDGSLQDTGAFAACLQNRLVNRAVERMIGKCEDLPDILDIIVDLIALLPVDLCFRVVEGEDPSTTCMEPVGRFLCSVTFSSSLSDRVWQANGLPNVPCLHTCCCISSCTETNSTHAVEMDRVLIMTSARELSCLRTSSSSRPPGTIERAGYVF